MIVSDSLAATEICPELGGSVRPSSAGYRFSAIPGTIESWLTGSSSLDQLPRQAFAGLSDHYDVIVMVVLDAFGWRFFEEQRATNPLLQCFASNGLEFKLATEFPSTTAAAITTLHSGQPHWQHGLYEWFCYHPLIDDIILPFAFRYADNLNEDSLFSAGFKPELIFPQPTFYQILKRHGIDSHTIGPAYYKSTYNTALCSGAEVCANNDLQLGCDYIVQALQNRSNPAYFCLYIDGIDSALHHFGFRSKEFESESNRIFNILNETLLKPIFGKVKNGLLLLTADHGHIEVSKEQTISLNLELPQLVPLLKRNAAGKVLKFSGSARDLFLHTESESETEAIELLHRHLEGVADVLPTCRLKDLGFWPEFSNTELQRRIGNIAVLPRKNWSVNWHEPPWFEMKHLSNHGGVSPEEMETIFLALPLGE